jgi:hypothetical protein
MQIDLRAKGAVITSHQLAYVGVPFDPSVIHMNKPCPPCFSPQVVMFFRDWRRSTDTLSYLVC